MAKVPIYASIDLDYLAAQLSQTLSEDGLLDFIGKLDENVNDLGFTARVRDYLQGVIESELE
ncbi:MAG: hypothetical protein IRZ03_08325 [Acidobacterium ailaaui]|nr:hypothetical protein [Pseudacidobacterium ailaaui]